MNKIKQEEYSYSKLEVYVNCPWQYKIKYIDKINPFTASVATDIGSMIHKCEEDIANAIINKEVIPYDKLQKDILDQTALIKQKYPVDYFIKDKANKTYDEKIYSYLTFGIYRLEKYMKAHPTYKIIGVELGFKFKFKKIYAFKGYIDRVFKDTATNKYIIQDIKTWPVLKDKKELTTPLQFVVYTIAAKELWGISTDNISCEYDLPFCDNIQVACTAGYLGRGTTKIDKILLSILEKQFEPKQSPLCHYCAFCPTSSTAPQDTKYICPYFSHWTKQNKKDFSKENEWAGLENHKAILEAYHKQYGIK